MRLLALLPLLAVACARPTSYEFSATRAADEGLAAEAVREWNLCGVVTVDVVSPARASSDAIPLIPVSTVADGAEVGGRYVDDAHGPRIEYEELRTDRERLVLFAHEMGHAMGLGDRPGGGGVMDPDTPSEVTPADCAALRAR